MTIYYLGVRFDKETNEQLLKYREDHGISLRMPALGFHITVIFSRTPFHFTIAALPTDLLDIREQKINVLGSSRRRRFSLAISFQSELLLTMHSACKSSGGTADYHYYRPHITIGEDLPVDYDLKGLPNPSITIRLQEIFYEEWN